MRGQCLEDEDDFLLFRSLPSTIGALTALVTLDMSYNHLESIPSEIGACTHLTTLDLQHNKLENLPDSIGNMRHLLRLGLRYNRLQVSLIYCSLVLRLQFLGITLNVSSQVCAHDVLTLNLPFPHSTVGLHSRLARQLHRARAIQRGEQPHLQPAGRAPQLARKPHPHLAVEEPVHELSCGRTRTVRQHIGKTLNINYGTDSGRT